MAGTSIMVHTPISGMTANNAVPGQLTIKVHTATDGYSDVAFFTGDEALAQHLVDAFYAYVPTTAVAP